MVSKGLDFDHVSLVGILNADNMLFFPEFRAHERAFQMMTQVSGRAGRREKRGKVIIQTANPEHFVIRQVIEHDYEGFYAAEILERRKFGYPPYSRLIRLTVAHKELTYASNTAAFLGNILREFFAARLLGPEPPAIGRIKNMFLFQILIKLNTSEGLAADKKEIRNRIDFVKAQAACKQARIIIDVDPV
jgi:primosomal protein N' (replication factor Y)